MRDKNIWKKSAVQTGIVCGLFLIAGPAALADRGVGDGGGGNAVVCFANPAIPRAIRQGGGELSDEFIDKITSIETFDLYQARLERGLHQDSETPEVIPVENDETAEVYIEKIATRFRKSVPTLGGWLDEGKQRFSAEQIIKQPHGLGKIDDVNAVGRIDATHCVLATMAAQYQTGQSYHLEIDTRLFYHPLHSRLSQAVLLIHEYVYSQARDMGQPDSRNTRAMVGYMITRKPVLTEQFLAEELFNLGFRGAGPVAANWKIEAYPYTLAFSVATKLLRWAKEGAVAYNLANWKNARAQIKALGGGDCMEIWSCNPGPKKAKAVAVGFATARAADVSALIKTRYQNELAGVVFSMPGVKQEEKNRLNQTIYQYIEAIFSYCTSYLNWNSCGSSIEPGEDCLTTTFEDLNNPSRSEFYYSFEDLSPWNFEQRQSLTVDIPIGEN